MRKFAMILLIASLFAQAGEFVPLSLTNSSTFETYSHVSTPQVVCTVDGVSGSWYHVSRFAALGPIWVKERRGQITLNDGYGMSDMVADFRAPVGSRWDIAIIGGATWAEVAERGTVSFPFGTFKTLRMVYGRDTLGWPPAMTQAIFAEGLGLIEWSGVNAVDGIDTYRLTETVIDGITYTGKASPFVYAPVGVAVSASGTYAHENEPNPNCRDCPVTPASVQLSLELTNPDDYPIRLFFSSSQTFDVDLVDEAGNLVKRWSDGKFFLMATRQFEVAGGDSFSVSGSFEMVGESGRPLPAGRYTLTMYLKGYPYRGTVPFEIISRY